MMWALAGASPSPCCPACPQDLHDVGLGKRVAITLLPCLPAGPA